MNGIRATCGWVWVSEQTALVTRMRVEISAALLVLTCLVFSVVGCVERTVSINSEPEGAAVFLNDTEAGLTPVKVPFTWYGDYDIVIRKEGYKTIHTHHRVQAPWYEWPFIDVVSECLVPFTIHDDHTIDTYVLETYEAPTHEELLQRAEALRGEALSDAALN